MATTQRWRTRSTTEKVDTLTPAERHNDLAVSWAARPASEHRSAARRKGHWAAAGQGCRERTPGE